MTGCRCRCSILSKWQYKRRDTPGSVDCTAVWPGAASARANRSASVARRGSVVTKAPVYYVLRSFASSHHFALQLAPLLLTAVNVHQTATHKTHRDESVGRYTHNGPNLHPSSSVTMVFNPLKPNSSNYCTLPYRPNLSFLISDIRALWRSALSARVPECQKLRIVG